MAASKNKSKLAGGFAAMLNAQPPAPPTDPPPPPEPQKPLETASSSPSPQPEAPIETTPTPPSASPQHQTPSPLPPQAKLISSTTSPPSIPTPQPSNPQIPSASAASSSRPPHLSLLKPPPETPYTGKLVASFRWFDGAKASAARPETADDSTPSLISYKGTTNRLPRFIEFATKDEFIAYCTEVAREAGASLSFINARGGRKRIIPREGKLPSQIGIPDGWRRYTVIIREAYYQAIEQIRQTTGKSHKEIVDAALEKELTPWFEKMQTQAPTSPTQKPIP